jgi:hypothetical protein
VIGAIAALVAQKEGMLETPVAETSRPTVELALTPSSWRTQGRPRIRQIGGFPKW